MMSGRPLQYQLAALGILLASAGAGAQSAHRIDVGVQYTTDHTNITPLTHFRNGGGVQLQVAITAHIDAVGAFVFTVNQNVQHGFYLGYNGSTDQVATYTGGLRVNLTVPQAKLRPFLEGQMGGANSFGDRAPSNNIAGASSNAFAYTAGGGLSLRLSSRILLVPFTGSFLGTTFADGGNNRQENFRISGGVAFRIR